MLTFRLQAEREILPRNLNILRIVLNDLLLTTNRQFRLPAGKVYGLLHIVESYRNVVLVNETENTPERQNPQGLSS